MAEQKIRSSGGVKDAEKPQRKQRVKEPEVEKLKAQSGAIEPFSAGLNDYAGESPEERHAALLAGASTDVQRANLAIRLQQTYGNRYVQRLIESINDRIRPAVSESAPDVGKGLIARELNQGVQPPKITDRQGENVVSRWAEHEHKAFGDLAVNEVMKDRDRWSFGVKEKIKPAGVGEKSTAEHMLGWQYEKFIEKEVGPTKEKFTGEKGKEGKPGVGVAHYKQTVETEDNIPLPAEKVHMSFGDATMLGGDYYKTADDLKEAQSVNPKEMWLRMVWVAATNVNHFFPLAGKEWQTQWGKAVAKAEEARAHHDKGDKSKADAATEDALRYLAVGCHFLQDTFASGHQYPGALDDITSLTALGTLIEGLSKRKTYHDALCALDKGLPMQYEGKSFHGDYKADADDSEVVVKETSHALSRILSIIAGKPITEEMPKHNPGPDVSAIMQDKDAAPIWTSMVSHLEESKLPEAREAAKKGKKGYETSAGTPYSAEEVIKAWKSPKFEELINNGLESDDAIRTIIKTQGVPKLTGNQAVKVCGALLSGYCGDDDERAFLEILKNQSDGVFRSVITELTPEYIDKCLHGKEWEDFLLMCARRYSAGENLGARLIARKKDDDTARALVFGKPAVDNLPLSPDEWTGIINALLSGSCGDEDEDAIVKIVDYLVHVQGKAQLIDMAIGKDKMDSGVDGKQWRQVKKIMKDGKVYW